MGKRNKIISFTFVAWVIGVGVYAHYRVTYAKGEYGPKIDAMLALLSFFINPFPYLLVGLIGLLIAELIFIPGPHGRPGSMV